MENVANPCCFQACSKQGCYKLVISIWDSMQSNKDCPRSQSDLEVLQEWTNSWQMKLNVLVLFILLEITHNYMICNEVIKQVNNINYLGITTDKQVNEVPQKVNGVRGFLHCNIKHYSPDIKNICMLQSIYSWKCMHQSYDPLPYYMINVLY